MLNANPCVLINIACISLIFNITLFLNISKNILFNGKKKEKKKILIHAF